MGRISGFLRAAAGEKGLRTAMGRWMQKVSEELDSGDIGSGTGFVQAARIANTVALVASTATAISFPTVQASENAALVAPIGAAEILYVPATGVWTLTPGLYDLSAFLVAGTFATDATDHLIFHWSLAATLDVPLLPNVVSDIYPGGSTVDVTSNPVNRVILRVAGPANVDVVVSATALVGATTVVNGAAAVPPVTGNSYALVRKIS